MNKRYMERNFIMLVGKLVKMEKACDERNEIHPFITRKKVALIDAWNLYCEQINIAEEFIEDYKSE